MSLLLGLPVSPLIYNTRRFKLDLSTAQVNALFTNKPILCPATSGYFFIPRAMMITKESGLIYSVGGNTQLGLFWNGSIVATATSPVQALGSNFATKTFINGMCIADGSYRGNLIDSQFVTALSGSLAFTTDGSNPSSGVGAVKVDALIDIYQNVWPF